MKRRDPEKPEPAERSPAAILHELEVHQTELEMQNEELRAARVDIESGLARYTELFDFAPIGYFSVGPEGVTREVNLFAAQLVGIERQRLVGRQFISLILEREQPAVAKFLLDVFEAGADESRACDATLGGGSAGVRDVRITGALLPRAGGPVALLAVEDVSARKRAESVVREEVRHKDEFLAALSHELRNPLASIRNSLYVLAQVEASAKEAHQSREIIERQVGHLARIVDDLLDVNRIAHGKIRLQRERIELGELVRRAMDDHRRGFERAGVELEARFASELLWIDADATRIAQVVWNLLGNAEKFSTRGDSVVITLRRDVKDAVLSVQDTGVGITPDVLPRLFEPFRQAPQTSERTSGGLGLGLAMVKGLVELHGGAVAGASRGAGLGAEFTIRLPLVGPPPVRGAASPERAGERRRVLVIEDNVDVAGSLRSVLALLGHDVEVAYDGPSGLALARQLVPDVVFCDIGLPGIDGYEVARALRRDQACRAALVAMTGYARAEDVELALDAGFDAHIAKPLDLAELERAALTQPSGPRPTRADLPPHRGGRPR